MPCISFPPHSFCKLCFGKFFLAAQALLADVDGNSACCCQWPTQGDCLKCARVSLSRISLVKWLWLEQDSPENGTKRRIKWFTTRKATKPLQKNTCTSQEFRENPTPLGSKNYTGHALWLIFHVEHIVISVTGCWGAHPTSLDVLRPYISFQKFAC